jgi:hypothetical protein
VNSPPVPDVFVWAAGLVQSLGAVSVFWPSYVLMFLCSYVLLCSAA